jgi:hypothetical protein
MAIREKSVEQHLIDRVEALGGIAPKWVSPGNNGVPDRIVIFPDMLTFVETKAPDGRLSGPQKTQHKRLKKLGWEVVVIWTKEQVDTFVELTASVSELMAKPERR